MSNDEELSRESLKLIATTSDLNVAIKKLEIRRAMQEQEIREDFKILLNNLKPTNILKHTLHEVQESTPLKHNLFKVALGLGAGYLSRKMVIGKSAGIVKKVLGTALQYGITNFVAKKNDDKPEDFSSPQMPKKKSLLKRILSI